MRVLQIINSLNSGGAEKLLVDACIKYQQSNIKVDVLLLNGVKTDFYKKLQKNSNINIYDLGENNDVYKLGNILKIKTYLKNYDIVHVHLFPASYFTVLAKKLTRTQAKFIFTEHNTTNRRRESQMWKPLENFIYRQYDALVSISKDVDESLKRHLELIKTPIHLIRNGIDLQEIQDALPYEKSELGFDKEDILILQVSSFTPQKEQKTAIKSIKNLPHAYKLLLVGEGPKKQECQSLSKQLELEERVLFLGFRNDVPQLLKTVNIVLLSSHYEGLSLASVEGLASTKPFVASDVSGLRDVVQEAGILFENENDKVLSQKLQNLIENEEVYNETVERCLIRAASYDINKMVSEYIDLYKTLLNQVK